MSETTHPTLRRRLNLPLMTLYGLGTTVGAGIYVLVGKVAARSGTYAPVSFVVAAILAGLTAFAFAELSARYPRSAGEAVYVREGFGSPGLAVAVGLLVVLAGLVSAATIVSGAQGYLAQLIDVPRAAIVLALVVLLGVIAAWGIGESVGLAAVITVVELGGLLLVVWVAVGAVPGGPVTVAEMAPPLEPAVWIGIMSGAFLAFYAFIGFEDMVNVAEEVKDVTRVLPISILLTLVITSLVYVALAVVAVLVVPVADLAASDAPLALLYQRSTGDSPLLITLIGVFATLNGALIQIIMGSRVLYGLAAQGWLPAPLSRIHPWTRTPLLATGGVAAVVLGLALGFDIEGLAGATSMVALTIFALVNVALLRIKRRDPAPAGIFVLPAWLPAAGATVSAAFLLFELTRLAGL